MFDKSIIQRLIKVLSNVDKGVFKRLERMFSNV